MRAMKVLCLGMLLVAAMGCKKGGGDKRGDAGASASAAARLTFPGTPEGARMVALELTKPNSYILSVFRALRPDPADYAAVFLPEVADAVRAEIDPIFDAGNVAINPDPALSELLIEGVPVEDLRAGTGKAASCPSAYKKAAKRMVPGVVVYCFKKVKPGETEGPTRDGLVFVNGHWAVFPKPFSAIRGALKDAGISDDDP